MVTIMTDSSCMMTVKEGLAKGVIVNPLTVTINNETYLDLEEMDSDTFLRMISAGAIPTSSQPSVGMTLEHYQAHEGEEVLNLTISNGLSGTYLTAQGAIAALQDDGINCDNIRVVNTKTLWAPQAYLVEKARQLAQENLSIDAILERLRPSLENHCSFLIPSDFDYLKRGGRLAPFVANIGGILKLMVVLHHSKDGLVLEKHAVARSLKTAVNSAIKGLRAQGVDRNHLLSISHAGAPHLAAEAEVILRKAFPDVDIDIHALSPAMITQGGPSCIAIQSILKMA